MPISQYSRTKSEISHLIDDLKSRSISVLPTEQELAEKLNVGRNTVRKVVGVMVEEGLLERIQGKGTFLTKQQNEFAFSNWISFELAPQHFMERLIADFEGEHEGIHVKDIPIPYYQYVNKLLELTLQGQQPDVVQMNSYWLRRFQKLNLFIPLDRYLTPQILKRRYTNAIKLGKIGDTIYALNWTLDPLVLFYNKVVMEKAGLDPENPPQTVEELAEQCIKINNSKYKNLRGFCLPFDMSELSFLCVYPLLLAFKGGFSDPIGNVIIDSEENVKALTWLSRFYRAGGMDKPTSINDARILFASDYLGFLFDNPGGRGHFRQISGMGKEFDSHYGICRIPLGPSGKSESVLLSHSLAISRNCGNPEAAYRWIEHLAAREDNAQMYFELFGMIPCDRNFLHNPFFTKDPFASVLIHQIESASVGPIDHPLFYKSMPFLIKIFSDVIHAGREPNEALSFFKETIGILAEADSFNVV